MVWCGVPLSNLAAVRLGLNKPAPALENAMEALRLDPAYAKGHYRKGQALMALARPGEAADAFRAGGALEPGSKLWTPLVTKAEEAAKEAPAAVSATNGGSNSSSSSGTNAVGVGAGSSTVSKMSASSTPAPAATTTAAAASGGGGCSSSSKSEPGSGMKGYKKTADGRTTTYFNNDLTEEAKALIGDIAPKKLEPAAAGGGAGAAEDGGGNDVSAWNKAGTWESRDMTRFVYMQMFYIYYTKYITYVCICAGTYVLRSTYCGISYFGRGVGVVGDLQQYREEFFRYIIFFVVVFVFGGGLRGAGSEAMARTARVSSCAPVLLYDFCWGACVSFLFLGGIGC